MTRDHAIVLTVCAVIALAALTILAVRLWPRHGDHEAPRGWRPAEDERMAGDDTRERHGWTAADMPFLPAEPPPSPSSFAGVADRYPGLLPLTPPPTVGGMAAGWLPRTPVPPPPPEAPWTGPHAVPDIPGTYDTGCTICGDPGHAAEGHDAIISILSPPSFRPAPPDGLPAYVREALHHDTVEQAMGAPSLIMAAYVDPGGDEETETEAGENGEDPIKIIITRMHLARHQDSHFPACDPRLLLPLQATTMDPGLVTCGNCKRTTLYQTAVRATEQIAVLGEHLAASGRGDDA